MKLKSFIIFIAISALSTTYTLAEDGYQLWLRASAPKPVKVSASSKSAIVNNAIKELQRGWLGEPGSRIRLVIEKNGAVKQDGFRIAQNQIVGSTDRGLLYGAFELLRRQRTNQSTNSVLSNPSYQHRILNHWDNLNGTIERGYAGRSIFWRGEKNLEITEGDRSRWRDYARACASVGINGSVLNNVNASPQMLSPAVLARVKAISDQLRPYGIKAYLSVNFSSPVRLGGLKTSDPLDPAVAEWWRLKVKEIYTLIPDFGGFLVKANSEGQPGPQDFGRTHADGANMLADILNPYNGIVMWRAFVYSPTEKDRARQAYLEFMPFDGKFRDNVIIQVKNGPIDFQPREPFSALFGAMKSTSVMPEFQVTQEYLGFSNHLVFLSTLWEECLKSDTYQAGTGSTVARTTDGSIYKQKHTAIAGVANTGLDSNWTGHHFAQANWYAFGRLAWNNTLGSDQIADEWLRLTFSGTPGIRNASAWESAFLRPAKQMMLDSREAAVNYMMPLGLHHIFSPYGHYGPGPWYGPKSARPDWTSLYYHQADSAGIGFNRTRSGTDAVSQYHEPLASQFNDVSTCPEKYLLWFHHLPWEYKMKSGRSLWNELCLHYNLGLQQVRQFQKTWDQLQPYVDTERFSHVQTRLKRQTKDAQVWKDACLLYFQTFSKKDIPYNLERPVYSLEYLKSVRPLSLFTEGMQQEER